MPILAVIPAILLLILRLVFGDTVAGWIDAPLWGILPAAVAIALRQILYQITDWRVKPVIILTTILHIVSIVTTCILLPAFDVWQWAVLIFLWLMTLIGMLKYRYKSTFMLILSMLSGFLLY